MSGRECSLTTLPVGVVCVRVIVQYHLLPYSANPGAAFHLLPYGPHMPSGRFHIVHAMPTCSPAQDAGACAGKYVAGEDSVWQIRGVGVSI